MATLYDTWDLTTQSEFNRDGTMRKDIRDRWIADGREERVLAIEYRMQREIADREILDRKYLEKCGQTLTDMELERREKRAEYNQKWNTKKRLKQDIANGEPLDSLSEYVEQDDYFDAIDF
jgi:hypothetical protein